MKEVVVFYAELVVYIDGEGHAIISVSMNPENCMSWVYDKVDELELLGHEVIVDEFRTGIL